MGRTTISTPPFRGHPLLHVREEQAAGTSGGGLAAGTEPTRVLNTVVTNEITGATLSANRVSLPPGKYFILASAPAHQVNVHALHFYDITGAGAKSRRGPNARSEAADFSTTRAWVSTLVEITATNEFDLRHWAETANSTDGAGVAGGTLTEVYAELMVWQIRAG